MPYKLPYVIKELEVLKAAEIVVNYFERQQGDLSQAFIDRAFELMYTLYGANIRHPLVLANKTIRLLESPLIDDMKNPAA